MSKEAMMEEGARAAKSQGRSNGRYRRKDKEGIKLASVGGGAARAQPWHVAPLANLVRASTTTATKRGQARASRGMAQHERRSTALEVDQRVETLTLASN